MSASLDRYAVIGNPVKHSKSPLIHAYFAEGLGQQLIYERIEAGLHKFEETVRAFFSESSNKGLNVTVPFKERACEMCDELTDRARFAEAVNTLYMQGGKLWGDNTDGCGLVNDIQNNNAISLKGKRVLLLGAGGAVKGVMHPILMQQPASVTVANRTLAKAEALVGRYKEMFEVKIALEACSFSVLDRSFDVVINGTSASLSGELPNICSAILSADTIVYDMMYADDMTVFNRWASANGASQTIDGLGMLVEQAGEAFRVWRNAVPDTKNCLAMLKQM